MAYKVLFFILFIVSIAIFIASMGIIIINMNYRIKQTYKWEKNRTYYYFDDITDIRKFEQNLLKIDKRSHKDFDIYYVGYHTIKKFINVFEMHVMYIKMYIM